MARRSETGLQYFPMNTDIIHNSKVKLLIIEFGPKSWAVLFTLYCKIYREKGYWIDWFDEDLKLLFANDECHCDVSFVNEVVNGCIRRGLFNKDVFDSFGVLTSDRIQENFLEGKKRNKDVVLIKEFLLTSDNVYKLMQNVNIIDLNVNILNKNANNGTQKENKIIEEDIIVEKKINVHSKKTIEERQKDFYHSLTDYLNYGKEMLRAFYDYWSEPNISKTKMRWEKEKTWDLSRRLKRWADNQKVHPVNKFDEQQSSGPPLKLLNTLTND